MAPRSTPPTPGFLLLASLIELAARPWRAAVWLFGTIAKRERLVQPASGRAGWVRIAVLGRRFLMPDHRWWKTFAGDWEAETLRVYRLLVRPGDTIVDVGTWIGPTVMFACACGAGRVLAIEPNPMCGPYLDALTESVARMRTRLTVAHVGVGPRTGSARFGNTDDHTVSTRSGASLFGSGATIAIEPLPVLLERLGFGQPDFVKIDIEGGEFLIADQIASLADHPDLRVWLSLHPPLLPSSVDRTPLLNALRRFDLYDSSLQPISAQAIAERVASNARNPAWGTVFGNYFELLLVPSGQPLLRPARHG